MMTTKQPSPELLSLIKAAAQGLQAFGTLWESIKKKGHDEGFTEPELQNMLRPMLRDNLGMDRNKIYYLFHKEERAVTNKEAYEKRRINQQIVQQKPIEQSDSSVAKVEAIDENHDLYEPEEDPKDTEIEFQKEKIAELEDALRQATEMKKASDLPMNKPDYADMNNVQWRMGLKNPDVCMDSIRREIPKLLNKGWIFVEVTMRAI